MNSKLQSYKELIVWQKSIDLVNTIYIISKALPKLETYGLASQIQRAAVAIPSNIAEGFQRNHRAEFIQFLGIAAASAAELDTQLIIIKQQYSSIDCSAANSTLVQIQKMLSVLIRNLRSKQNKP